MGRMRKRGRGVTTRNQLRLRHVADVENVVAVMPITDVEPIAHAHRMVAARRRPRVPGIRLAAGLPLPRDPPTPDLFGAGRILQIEDHHDVADVALGGRRNIGIASVEIVAVYALSRGSP